MHKEQAACCNSHYKGIKVKDSNKFNKLIKKAGSVVGTRLASLEEVMRDRMLGKINTVCCVFLPFIVMWSWDKQISLLCGSIKFQFNSFSFLSSFTLPSSLFLFCSSLHSSAFYCTLLAHLIPSFVFSLIAPHGPSSFSLTFLSFPFLAPKPAAGLN